MYLKDSEKVVSISSEHLEPVTPIKGNKVRAVSRLFPLVGLQGASLKTARRLSQAEKTSEQSLDIPLICLPLLQDWR